MIYHRAVPEKAAAQLATFTSGLAFEAVPSNVVEAAKLQLLDTVGVALAARGTGAMASSLRPLDEAGQGPASVVGRASGLPAAEAAYANGVLAHALDFDDTHAESIAHVSAVVCPAALATAEALGAGGRELLLATIAGKETTIRIGMGAAVAFLERGFHPTAVIGVFGATAAAAKLRGLDATATAGALGIAGSLAAGSFAYLADGANTKPLHAGFAARGGVHAAALAAAGVIGPPSVVEARFGLYDAYIGRRDAELDLDDLGTRWEILRVAVKAYPACHFVHASAYGAHEIAVEAQLDLAAIDRVVVHLPAPGVEVVCEPVERKTAPQSVFDAKFSMQYSVAAMLVHGALDIGSFSEQAIADPAVVDMARRVTWETREYASYPAAYPGGIDIHLESGELLSRDYPHQPGSAELPLSADAVRDKFRRNAQLALAADDVERVERAILRLEQLGDLAELTGLLRRA